jgi:hypothetical protein
MAVAGYFTAASIRGGVLVAIPVSTAYSGTVPGFTSLGANLRLELLPPTS